MKMTSRPLRSSIVALLGTAGLFLASCADDGGSGDEAAPTPQLSDVDSSTFEIAGNHMFRYVLDGESGECSISERGAMCMGTAGDDIPEVKVDPFPVQSASAVSVGVDGTEYLIFEGGPPAPATLSAGERVTLGNSACSVPDDSTLTCEYDGASFTLEGAEALITTSDEPVGRYFVDEDGADSSSTGSTGTRNAGDSCGTARSTVFPGFDGANVEVRQGPVDCEDAMQVLDEYLATPTDADHGNANIRQYGEWNCAMPTYGSSQQSGFSLNCTGPDGESIGIRN